MQDQLSIQNLLQTKLTQAQAKNPRYSLRTFSQKLGIAAGPLSQILAGNRRVSRKMAVKFCDALMLDPTEKAQVLKYFQEKLLLKNTKTDSVDHDELLKLTADQFKVVSEWYYYGILSLLKTTDFKNNPTWIAERLGISRSEVSVALSRMLRLNLIQEVEGKYEQVQPKFRTTDDVINLSLRKAHHQTLELASKSLEQDSVEVRDFTTITMPTNLSKLAEAKVLIRKFQSDLCNLMMDTDDPNEVYRMSVELFPLTKLKNKPITKNQK